jgi:lysophosphatidylcholine acyltransferase/lyso-PAF acetyltransferase
MKKKILSPIVIFPEGTTTIGQHILKFKKGKFAYNLGAFHGLLPVKPYILKNPTDGFSINVGSAKLVDHIIMSLCYLYHDIEVYKLPIIKPTSYMYENYNHYGQDKWEIYAEVVRDIYCEIGGFEKSEKTFRDTLDYVSTMHGVKVKNT